MALVGLHDLGQDSALLQKVCQSRHIERVEQVDFEEEFVSDMVSEERNAFDEGNVGNKSRLAVVRVPAIADGERMVDGDTQTLDISINYVY